MSLKLSVVKVVVILRPGIGLPGGETTAEAEAEALEVEVLRVRVLEVEVLEVEVVEVEIVLA